MRASYKWLKSLSGVDASPEEVAQKLTSAGLEVEGVEPQATEVRGVVVAEVRSTRPHPERDKLRLVTVFDGEGEQEVVCGAPNVPASGGRVLLARLGASLPGGFEITERRLGGVVSRGMLCSETELGIGGDSDGIFVFEPSEWDPMPAPGTDAVRALDLDDTIFEIGLTPNRPDCLGHVGLARELALLCGQPFTAPEVVAPARLIDATAGLVPEADPARFVLDERWRVGGGEELPDLSDLGPVSVRVDDGERCPRYGAALVLGASVGPSPFWLRYRLHCLGVRSLGNLVDATNLVMLETGHPIHGFDLRKLRGRRIVVRQARAGESMKTLDGVERLLGEDDLLICDAEGPVALAGVMGGLDSEIGDDTEHVLIECAYFDPPSVRRTSRRTGLHTDASHRFERGVDSDDVRRVLARAVQLIAELGGGVAARQALDVVARPLERPTIRLRHGRVERLLGVDVPRARSRAILEGLGCEVRGEEQEALVVRPPSHRPDLGREVDLVEEVIRVHGYEHIPTRTPRVLASSEGTPEILHFERRLRESAAASGLNEALDFGFVSVEQLQKARVSTDAVPLANPLSEERAVMRTSLLPGLCESAGRAQRRGARLVELFEVGRVFAPSADVLPDEEIRFALLLLGARDGWIGGSRPVDFFDAKGHLEAICRSLMSAAPLLRVDDPALDVCAFLHPRRRAAVYVEHHHIGVIGELHPDVAEDLELVGPAAYVDLSLPKTFEAARERGVPQAKMLPRFPSVTRDVALVVSEALRAGDIADAMCHAAEGLAESVQLFDLYRGEHVPPGQKSLAFRVVYRDPESTLTDKRVDEAHARVVEAARKRFDAVIR